MRVAIYVRVSTKDKRQDPEYRVKADRTDFKQLLLEAYRQKFDPVVFWQLDRLSREDALATLPQGNPRLWGKLQVLRRALLNSLGPLGDVIVSLLATIAAQDLLKISENTKAAPAKKKTAGVQIGVQLGAPTKSTEITAQVRRLKGVGTSNQAIARALRISPSTVAK